jgi:hypothetical protein
MLFLEATLGYFITMLYQGFFHLILFLPSTHFSAVLQQRMWHLHFVQCGTLEWKVSPKISWFKRRKHKEIDDVYMGHLY